ncbi:MAG: hypothetical protein CME31_24740 [Gimesia sp.]|jgi:hypothetical protein|nr:hypothetical protein [Gimesia sp.]
MQSLKQIENQRQKEENPKSLFQQLSERNVNEHTETKGSRGQKQLTYLSWPYAVNELKKASPDAYWEVSKFKYVGQEGVQYQLPYMRDKSGYAYVEVTVYADGVPATQIHPVLDNYNRAVRDPDSFAVNTSIMRCLTKAISLHGLGLYIYAGEDLPEVENGK